MSIVSGKLGVVEIGVNKYRRGIANAIQTKCDDVEDSLSVSQKPTFNSKCCKPNCPPIADPTTPYPLYSLQQGSDFPKTFFQEYEGEKLPAAPPKAGNTITQLLQVEDTVGMEVPFNYKAGIRPGAPRTIKFDNVSLPSNIMFRQ